MALPRCRRYHPWEIDLERPAASSAALEPSGPDGADLAAWLEVDEATPRLNRIRADLFGAHRDDVFVSETGPAIDAAKLEVLDHVVGFLVRHLPAVYQLADGGAELVDRSDPAAPRTTRIVAPFALGDPLLTAASLVNEDLVIMVPSSRFPAPPDRDASNDLDDDYRLAAAVVCFPAHWCLKEKFSQGLSGIHKHVPVFMDRLLPRVKHLFNAIGVGPNYTVRKNWFIYDSPRDQHDLFQPEDEAVKHGKTLSPEELKRYWATQPAVEDLYIRIERQTLSRLPLSGAVLFTIRSYQHPLTSMAQAQFRQHAATLAQAIRRLDEKAWRYKKADRWSGNVLPYLDGLAAGTMGSPPPTKSRL